MQNSRIDISALASASSRLFQGFGRVGFAVYLISQVAACNFLDQGGYEYWKNNLGNLLLTELGGKGVSFAGGASSADETASFFLTGGAGVSSNQLLVSFSSAPQTAAATNTANYCVSLTSYSDFAGCSGGGATIALSGAALSGSSATLTFAVATLSASTYNVYVQNVTSATGEALSTTSTAITIQPFNVNAAASASDTSVLITFSAAPEAVGATTLGNYCVTTDSAHDTYAACNGDVADRLNVSGTPVVNGTAVTVTTAAQNVTTYYVLVQNVTSASLVLGLSTVKASFTGTLPATICNGLVINEFREWGSTDTREFVEIKNTSGSTIDLANCDLVHVNGANGQEEWRFTLSGNLNAGAYACYKGTDDTNVTGCTTQAWPANGLQSGSPEADIIAVAVRGSNNAASIVHYGVAAADSDGGFPAVGSPAGQSPSTLSNSMNRCPDGNDSGDNSADFFNRSRTPGAANDCPVANATLKITEIKLEQSDDRIEFVVTDAGPLTGMRVLFSNTPTVRYTFPETASFNVGDIIVLHGQYTLTGTRTDETNLDGSTGINAAVHVDATATAYDFWDPANSSITSTTNEIEIQSSGSSIQDYLPYTNLNPITTQATRVQAKISAGQWASAVDPVTAPYIVDSTIDSTTLCLQRTNTGAGTTPNDTNSVVDWVAGTCATGTQKNVPVPAFNVTSATVVSNTSISVLFSHVVISGAASAAGNYAITGGGGLTVSGAVLADDGKTVTLTTASQTAGQSYTVTVSNVNRYGDSTGLTTTSANFTGFGTTISTGVVISEVGGCRMAGTAGGSCTTQVANDEFVELYNPTAGALSIANHKVCRRTAAGGAITEFATIPGGATIAARGYYLVGGAGYTAANYAGTPAADHQGTGTGIAASTQQTIYLISSGNCNDADATVAANLVDAVANGTTFGDSANGVWLPTPGFTTLFADGASIERKACNTSTGDANASTGMHSGGGHASLGNGQKTSDSASSWVHRSSPAPQNASSATETPACP